MNQSYARAISAALAMLALCSLAGCQQAPASGTTSISYQDTRTLPAETLKDRLMAQLDAILTPAPPPPRQAPFISSNRFNDTWMATEPRLDEGGGMCTYDLLRLRLAPDTSTDDPDANTPNHATGIETTTWFTPVPVDAKDCAGRHPAAVHYFESDDPLYAQLDFAMLKDALARLASPSPGYALTCEDDICGKAVASLKAETLWDIKACYYAPAVGRCRHFSWRDPEYIEMDIVFATPKLDRSIVSVRVEPGAIIN